MTAHQSSRSLPNTSPNELDFHPQATPLEHTPHELGAFRHRELPLWLGLFYWALFPSTWAPWVTIAEIPMSTKDLVLPILALFYLLESLARGFSPQSRPWHYHLPLLTLAIVVYACLSTAWSTVQPPDRSAMIYALTLSGTAMLVGFCVVAGASPQEARRLLDNLVFFLAAVGTLYFAESYFALGLRQGFLYAPSIDFGIDRVRGPLFGASAGYFILTPAIAYVLNQATLRSVGRIWNITLLFLLTLTLIGLGSRAALLLLLVLGVILLVFLRELSRKLLVLLMLTTITLTAWVLVFSRAETERLRSLEDHRRFETHATALEIVRSETPVEQVFGSGLGSYWPWYLTDVDPLGPQNSPYYFAPTLFGPTLYHPHSTFLFLAVELGCVGIIFFGLLWLTLIRLLRSSLRAEAFPIFASGLVAGTAGVFFDFFVFKAPQVSCIYWLFVYGALRIVPRATRTKDHALPRIS